MYGMKLNSETEFAEVRGAWLNQFNTAYIVAFAAVFLLLFFGSDTGIGGAFFGGIIACYVVLVIKQKTAQMKRYGIAEAVFSLDTNLTTAEIGQKVAVLLLKREIETIPENDKLTFKGKNVSYTFIRSTNSQSFSLDWKHSIVKIFSPLYWPYIKDYREILEETGTIAYYIQQVLE